MVVKVFSRMLFAFSALIFLVGGSLHALAFPKASTALSTVSLIPFYSNSFRALWLIDSATLVILAILFAIIAIRPQVISKWAAILVALIPFATAVLIYVFVGSFFAAHMLLGASLAAILGGLMEA
jgi:hypothetical protein